MDADGDNDATPAPDVPTLDPYVAWGLANAPSHELPSMPADQIAPVVHPDAALPPPMPAAPDQPPVTGLQPGLGIPAAVVDQAMPAQTVADQIAKQGGTIRTEGTPEEEAKRAHEDAYRAYMTGNVDPDARQEQIDKMTPDDQAAAVQKMSPEEYIQYKSDRAGKMMADQAAKEHALAVQNEKDARAERDDQIAAANHALAETQAMQARAQALANQKVDPDRYTKNRGWGGAIRDTIGIILGGAFSGNGPNMALQRFNKKIDDDIAAQKDDIANQWKGVDLSRNAIASELAYHGDINKAQQTYRVAAYQSAINDLQTQLQNYDPNGATATRTRDALDQFHAAQGKAIQDFQKDQLEQNLKIAAERRQQAAQQEIARHNKASEGLDWAKYGLEKAKAAAEIAPAVDDEVHPPQYYADLGLPTPPAAMSTKAYSALQGMKKTANEASKAETEAQGSRTAGTVYNPVTKEPLQKDGKPVILPPEQAKDLNEHNAQVQQVVDGLSDVYQALDADPSTFDRKQWAKIQSNVGTAKANLAGYLKAKFSERELHALNDITDLDFDSYANRVKNKGTAKASIDAMITTLKRDSDTTLGALTGYKGGPLPLDTHNPKPADKTTVDKLSEDLGRTAPEGAEGKGILPNPFEPDSYAETQARAQQAFATGMLPEHADALNSLKGILYEGKTVEERDRAHGALVKAMTNGASQAIQGHAAEILRDWGIAGSPGAKPDGDKK